ncbi:MAG: PHB depolymerase family esterase [Lysobacteraceae bacterium]|nr:MAG: PHB depolymerase family esterase [Xanthomonadaceae bacterium]
MPRRRNLFSIARRPSLRLLSSTFTALGRLLRATPAPKARAKSKPIIEPKPKVRAKARTTTQALPGFTRHLLNAGGHRHSFHVFIPSAHTAAPGERLPLLVMLHGCKQDGPDFATGTRMNALADRLGFIVVYPEQAARANGMKCWNWFEPQHQSQGGEPGVIAAITRRVIRSARADPARVYIAGLSAGGAMALTVAHQFPEIFAAVGVHSGLPQGAAISAGGALAAMRSGAAMAVVARASRPLPTIVFHGTHDRVVHAANGQRIVAQALTAFQLSGLVLADAGTPPAPGRRLYSDAAGRPQVEAWELRGVGHAWSGGDAAGGFTAPSGPDASAALMDFLLRHRRMAETASLNL